MQILKPLLCLVAIASPALAQTHARHTAAHDSAHAIMLSDADHVALHQFLLGRWTGTPAGGMAHDTLHFRFEDDASHQQLLVRHSKGLTGFEIRGDTLRWKQDVSGSACTVSAPVSGLLQAAKSAAPRTAPITGTMLCGTAQSPVALRKTGT